MKIGIIGAGRIGAALTQRFTALGHHVQVANSRGPQTLADLAAATGATPVIAERAADGVDLIVLAVPLGAVVKLPGDVLSGAVAGTPIIDTGNYHPQGGDGPILEIEEGTPETVWVQQNLGRGPVVKAFNTIAPGPLLAGARPAGTPGRIALPVAADNQAAKALVMTLIESMGFDAVDAGSLDDSWRQQPGTPVYATDLDADAVRAALAEAQPGRLAAFRA